MTRMELASAAGLTLSGLASLEQGFNTGLRLSSLACQDVGPVS